MICGESIDHLFTTCAFTTQVWGHWAHCLAIHILQLPIKLINLWSSWRLNSFNKQERVIWDLTATAVLWGMWKERNNRIFNNQTRPLAQTSHVCVTFFSYWLNLLSGTSRALAERVVEQPGEGVSDRLSEDSLGGGGHDSDTNYM